MKKVLLLLLVVITGLSVNAQDIIKLKNGNILNGEVKDMDRGVLTIETPYSDSDFKVEWEKIVYIKTKTQFIVSLSKSKLGDLKLKSDTLSDRISSNLVSDFNDSTRVILTTPRGKRSVDLNHIVYLKSFNSSFFSRLSATVDVGYNLTKANNLKQFNVSSTLSYLADKWGANAGLNIVDSQQDGVDRVHRLDANIGFNWYLPKDFYLGVSSNILENDEMKLDIRSTFKAGLGFFILRTNHLYWNIEGGLAYNYEKYSTEAGSVPPIDPNPRKSQEGYLGAEINLFDIGDLNLLSNIVTYPSLSEKGRFRYDFKFEAKYDLPFDLYIKAGTIVNYDNSPAKGASEYDYVINTGIGWEWN